MPPTSLESFVATASSAWPAIQSDIGICRDALARLAGADASEPWLADLHAEKPASRELYRHPVHGFVLLAHTETEGLYRSPHDHGRAWVLYAVQSGALEVGTYERVIGPAGQIRLVERDRSVIRAGEARAYRPGEIHDTRCISQTALLFRFTERDLRHEDEVEGQVTRFVLAGDHWTVPIR